MTKEEYQKRQQELYKEYDDKVRQLNAEFAIDNNPYKTGDIFRDHIGYIEIEKIDIGKNNEGLPCCIYFGPELKVDLTPKKNGAKRNAWQCNEAKLITTSHT